jgi:hypothetical protein
MDPANLLLMQENNIILGKPPGSTTEVTQPCDAYMIFKGPKTCNRKIKDGHVIENQYMLNILGGVFKDHHAVMTRDSAKAISPNQKLSATMGLLRVQLALRLALRGDIIQKSFQVCGIYPYSLRQILANCKTPIPEDEVLHIESIMPQVIEALKKDGEASDELFDLLNVRKIADEFSKDQLVMYRRRACILTNMRFIQRELDKLDPNSEYNLNIAARKTAAKDAEKAAKDAVKATEKAVKDAAKAIEKAAKDAVKAVTKEAKDAEKATQKLAKELEKAAAKLAKK